MRLNVLGSLLLLCVMTAPMQAGEWYRWRGPEQNGVCREKNLPDSWSAEGENVLWKNEHVGGMSSPIVMNGRVYTFARVGEVPAGAESAPTLIPGPRTQEALTCIDAKTGRIVWQHLENMTQTDDPFWRMGWSNPVGDPATGRVYALGAQCTLVCCDGQSGQVVWKRQMTEEFGMISTFGGRTPSPAIDEDQLFIGGVSFGWGEHGRGQHRLFAFNKKTGELNWSAATGGTPVDAPQNTPVVAVINGQRLVLLGAGDGGVHAFQSRTGKKVWSFQVSKRGLNASVVVDGGRVYACSSEDNLDSNRMGRVCCIDASGPAPREMWFIHGIEAGFPSPTIYGGRLYVIDNKAIVYAIDAMTGKICWKKTCGRIGKASLVYGDGKLYVAEANGRVSILKIGDSSCEVLSKVELTEKLGREYVIYGSVAISDGRVYLQSATTLYCIGSKDHVTAAEEIPSMPKETPIDDRQKPAVAWVQVTPADVLLHPGQKQAFCVKTYDALGRLIGQPREVQWSIGQLTMPTAPPPPTSQLTRPRDNVAGNAPVAPGGAIQASATVPPVAPAATAATQPVKIGNLKGAVDEQGVFAAASGGAQGGAVVAACGNVSGYARVRVLPPLPWTIDFAQSPVGKPPLTWTGAGGKFAVREMDGRKVLVKLTDIPLYARARTNFGSVDMHDYTVQADVRATETLISEPGQAPGKMIHKMPDAGIINSRYVLELQGSDQRLNIHAWPTALPYSVNKTLDWNWQANKWYRMKLTVSQGSDRAIVKGKVWDAGAAEPDGWSVELEDFTPNRNGNPGLWGFSNDLEIYYANIVVTDNASNNTIQVKKP